MRRCRLSSVLIIVSALAANAPLADAGEQRGLVELFTSQGCSSCPAADRVLGELATDSSLVALSLPIDYWDYLGWKDTLASPAHSARQRAYAHARGDREVYTPQIVVNGATHVLGSDHAAVERAIAQTDRNTVVMSVPVTISVGDNEVNIKVVGRNQRVAGEVWLCPLARAVSVQIGRGENHGRTITYHNVVRHWLKLGDWNGADLAWSVPLSEIVADQSDAVAVIVQEGTREKPGLVLGAAYAPIGRQTTENK